MSEEITHYAPEPAPTLAVKPARPNPTASELGITFSNMDEMARFCQAVHNSGLAPRDFRTPEAIMVAMQHGMELGLPPMQAIQSIAVINGRPCVWGDTALALVTCRPEFEDIEETLADGVATCTIKRKGRSPVTRTFSEADARKAGLWGKSGPWSTYPQRMLQMRARSWAMRDSFPDALRGVAVREEVQDIPAEPKKIEAKIVMPDEEETK